MPNPLAPLLNKILRPRPMRLAQRFVVGIAHDFWADGTEQLLGQISFGVPLNLFKAAYQKKASAKSGSASVVSSAVKHTGQVPKSAPGLWHALPGEISEKMWGQGYIIPGDEAITKLLTEPLGLNKDVSLLDLSAGLGARLRSVHEAFQAYVTGLETDVQIASRGTDIAAYHPANFSVARRYDCIIARELFYRVADRDAFFAVLATATKPGAQISFTDYVVNPEHRDNPGIKAFMTSESGANPASVVEMAEAWAKVGFKLRVLDDQTDLYLQYVNQGLRKITAFMASGVKPDAETKKALAQHLKNWVLRIGALQSGMRFYRFYGTKM